MDSIRVRAELLEQMVAHAGAVAPLEACGLLGGLPGCALAVYPIANVAQSAVRYTADPQGLVEAFLDIEARGWEIVGIYHSHPGGPATPSSTDVAEAYYPDAVYIIISLVRQPPSLRGFRIRAGQVNEVALVCEQEAGA